MDKHDRFTFSAEELTEFKDNLRKGFLQYTRRAFHALPHITSPHILDVGCGSGVPTLELARLSRGKVTAIDINQAQLDRLAAAAESAGLSEHIKIINCSMLDLDFPAESFDIIWAEGSIAAIGFERGLKEWRRFLKPGGFLIVHDDLGNLNMKIQTIPQCGYELLEHFTLNNNIWWDEYYAPLDKKLKEIRKKYQGDRKLNEILGNDQREIDGFNPGRYRSVFFVMKKI